VRYWRVTFAADGTVEGVTEIDGAGAADWLVVRAETEELARRKGYNIYCARKKKARIAQLYAEGRCRCGRAQDIEGQVSCTVCIERSKGWRAQHKSNQERKAEGLPAEPRDEAARIASFQTRSRDRKSEIRLETLLEVRRWWIEARNVGLFGARLQKEIQACMGQAVPENDSEQLAAS
jgi:hypothetical protein